MLHLTFTTWKTIFELFHIEVYSRNPVYKKISFSREFSEVNFYRISRKSSQPESLEHFHRRGCSPVICISRIANQKTGLLNICIIGECQRNFFYNFFSFKKSWKSNKRRWSICWISNPSIDIDFVVCSHWLSQIKQQQRLQQIVD